MMKEKDTDYDFKQTYEEVKYKVNRWNIEKEVENEV